MNGCPEENQLVQFAHGLLEVADVRGVSQHLDSCDTCRRVVAAVAQEGVASAPRPGVASDHEEPTQHDGSEPQQPMAVLPRGASVGRYVILEQLGAGGMGIVYAAYDPQLDRRVALKLVRSGGVGSSPEGRARLLREAQTMARLSHPNIVVVHDVGAFEDNVFVAMELVAGQNLKAWLAKEKRPWREVLHVYAEAGRGLAAAHAAGLVHRDFKPENVLLAADGRVRVTDFGLARQLDDVEGLPPHEEPDSLQEPLEASLSDTLTRTGVLVGTPAYMAPEQAARGKADARSDQFSFCVSLYEGLHGERPFAGASLRDLTLSILKNNVRPPPAGSDVPVWLRRVLLRGLAADPDRRHPSMGELLHALRADPAAARRKVAIGVTAALVLAAVTAGTLELTRASSAACRGAERKLARVWDAARREQLSAAFARLSASPTWDRVWPLLDGYSHEWRLAYTEACEATSVRHEQSEKVLDLRMRCLDRRLAELKAVGEVLLQADEIIADNAVKLASGLPELSTCLESDRLLAESLGPADPEQRRRADAVRLRISQVKLLSEAGKLERAGQLGATAVEEAAGVGDPSALGEAHFELGRILFQTGHPEEGLQHLEDAAVQGQVAQDRVLLTRAWSQLATFLALRQQRTEEARRWLRYARAAVKPPPADAVLEAQLDSTEAVILQSEGKLGEAEVLFERAARRVRTALGRSSPRLSNILNNLVVNHLRSGKFQEGIEVGEELLAYRSNVFGPQNVLTAQTEGNLAICYASVGRHEEAIAKMQHALAVRVKAMGAGNAELVFTYRDACLVYGLSKRFDDAEAMCGKAIALSEQHYGAEHPNTADMLGMLGDVRRQRGDCAAAMPTLQKAIALKVKAQGSEHLDLAELHRAVGLCQLAQGALEKAGASLQTALEGYQRSTVTTTDLALTQVSLARALKALRRDAPRVRTLAEEAAKIYEAKGARFAADAKQARALAEAVP